MWVTLITHSRIILNWQYVPCSLYQTCLVCDTTNVCVIKYQIQMPTGWLVGSSWIKENGMLDQWVCSDNMTSWCFPVTNWLLAFCIFGFLLHSWLTPLPSILTDMLTHTCLSLAYPSITKPLVFSYKSLTKPLFFLQILLTHPYVYKAPGAQRSPGGIPPSIAWNYPSLSLSLSVFLYSLSLVGFSASLKASVFKSSQVYRSWSISLGSDRV